MTKGRLEINDFENRKSEKQQEQEPVLRKKPTQSEHFWPD